MGTRITIGDRKVDAISYSVTEASTPTSLADTSGEVGDLTFAVPSGATALPWYIPRHEPMTLTDGRRGHLIGKTRMPSIDQGERITNMAAVTRLADLNIYNVSAAPYLGTLGGAFAYYLSLAGITDGFRVEGGIESRPVRFIGWHGELWFNLKSMCASNGVEIALVSDVIVMRPIRQREAIRGRDTARALMPAGSNLAQSVEVYHYLTRPLHGGLVYPPQGWNEEVEVITINAGEMVEQTLELGASVSHIDPPTCVESVGPEQDNMSVYTVTGSDGLPVTPAAWHGEGGWLTIEIGEDTTTAILRAQAPARLPSADGSELTTYSIAMASGTSNLYSSLRLVGDGIEFYKKLYTFTTGVSPQRASQEVGITIDNPFLTELDDVFSCGAEAARAYSGRHLALSGSVTAVNQLGNQYSWRTRTYADMKEMYADMTYAEVKALTAGKTYGQLKEENRLDVRDEFPNQVFGNVGGARVWDKMSRNWFRIRRATIGPDTINFEGAEQDTTYEDIVKGPRAKSLTYADIKELYGEATYAEVSLRGVLA